MNDWWARPELVQKLNASIAGSRVVRKAARPHEVRIYLLGSGEESVWLHFWPATETRVELCSPASTIASLTVEGNGEQALVRLWADETLVCECEAPEWSWHPYRTFEDEFLWQLTEDEKALVRRAAEAVAGRDVEAVRQMAPAAAEDGFAERFWVWVDDYTDKEPLRLLPPPAPFDDWEGYVIRRSDGTEVGIEFFDANHPARLTDLTLRLELSRTQDGRLTVCLEDLHVM